MPENSERDKDTISNEEIATKSVEIAGRKTEITDLKEKVIIPRKIKNWIEELEEDPNLNKGNKIQGDDDSVLKPITPAVTKIILPTNRTSFTNGFTKPVDQAWRWLSEFVLRIIKKNQGKVKFKEE